MKKLNTDYDTKLDLKEELLLLPGSNKTSKGVSILCPNPECNDRNRANANDHGHCNIRIDLTSDEIPVVGHCFLCDYAFIMDNHHLRMLDICDTKLSSRLTTYNNKAKRIVNKKFGQSSSTIKLKSYKIIDECLANKKLEYINNRLGTDITIEDVESFKIVPNLGELLMVNKISQFTTSKDKVRNLHNCGVGFLSCENHYCNIRNITNSGERYYKYKLLDYIVGGAKMYIIPSSFDILTTDTITINIAEGTFDILGIYFHVVNEDKFNNIFIANNGSGFSGSLDYLLMKGFFGDNIHINIYSDKDHDYNFYTKLIERMKKYVGHMTLYYNEIGKDYGVRKEEIKLIKRTLF